MSKHLQELPSGQNTAQLTTLLNDRFRDLQLILDKLMSNPAEADLDMANFRIIGLADPQGDLDGVNLRTLKRLGGSGASAPVTTAGGKDAYTIVSESAGRVLDGDIFPAYVVGKDRIGVPSEVWIYAAGSTVTDCSVNWQVQPGGAGAFRTLLSSDLVLPAGTVGPVFASNFAFRGTMPHGTVVLPGVTTGGGASLLSIGLVVKRS